MELERSSMAYEGDDHHLNLKATELRLGLPGTGTQAEQSSSTKGGNKRASPETSESRTNSCSVSDVDNGDQDCAPPAKAQIVGWPPIRSYRKNCVEVSGGRYVKVSVDGAAYLRKIDLKVYKSYPELVKGLENMLKLTIGGYSEREGYNGSDYTPTYEDKDGDWMLVGDVPWDMFICSCKRLRIMRGSEARGL
ncbi:auxin-induced protein 22D-like [Euphorbia lathyris]|uniref:auxin-induced protein 22D-like n=1 Tax=Euphorbia lathyris TaxID=212925 RepID=UPI0033144003